jgi:hypothetical protein
MRSTQRPQGLRTVKVSRIVVCLPSGTEPRLLPELATAKLGTRGLRTNGTICHFAAKTRRASKLVDRWRGLTSGGPIALLDLAAMRRHAQAAAAAQWIQWQDVVAGTRPAQLWWAYRDKFLADPRRYPLARAQDEFRAQPRVLAMDIHNALPTTWFDLPLGQLEAFQAGYQAYVNLAWLSAVPADGLATAHGEHDGWLTSLTGRFTDQLTYLRAANTHLDGLHPATQLIAMAAAH